ncbi:hypothetical protein IF1G_00938 [Cordyceps javanica]|uniref:Uncharacterized protein n=1 Tax=Cordyceps javanica TaxID=43265 RepID=A0A545VH06_9HYPO|nr:hypothetical protein IF1G_00938 [Cordyceps javanica]
MVKDELNKYPADPFNSSILYFSPFLTFSHLRLQFSTQEVCFMPRSTDEKLNRRQNLLGRHMAALQHARWRPLTVLSTLSRHERLKGQGQYVPTTATSIQGLREDLRLVSYCGGPSCSAENQCQLCRVYLGYFERIDPSPVRRPTKQGDEQFPGG